MRAVVQRVKSASVEVCDAHGGEPTPLECGAPAAGGNGYLLLLPAASSAAFLSCHDRLALRP